MAQPAHVSDNTIAQHSYWCRYKIVVVLYDLNLSFDKWLYSFGDVCHKEFHCFMCFH
jgi:hypothetical protein